MPLALGRMECHATRQLIVAARKGRPGMVEEAPEERRTEPPQKQQKTEYDYLNRVQLLPNVFNDY